MAERTLEEPKKVEVNDLINQLDNPWGNKKAIEALIKIGKDAVPKLFEVSMDLKNEVKAQAAADTIIKSGDKALPFLVKKLSSDQNSLTNSVYLIGKIFRATKILEYSEEGILAIESLCNNLQNQSTAIRVFSAGLLGLTNSSKATGPLINLLEKNQELVSKEAEVALIQLGKEAVGGLIEIYLQKKSQKIKEILIKIGSDAFLPIVKKYEEIIKNENPQPEINQNFEELIKDIPNFGKFCFEQLYKISIRRDEIKQREEFAQDAKDIHNELRQQRIRIEALSKLILFSYGENFIAFAEEEKQKKSSTYVIILNDLITKSKEYEYIKD